MFEVVLVMLALSSVPIMMAVGLAFLILNFCATYTIMREIQDAKHQDG